MADIESVLERLVTDPQFRTQLHEDPARALKGYDLDASDLELLAAQFTEDAGQAGSVEQRTSKSAMGGLVGLFAEQSETITQPNTTDFGFLSERATEADGTGFSHEGVERVEDAHATYANHEVSPLLSADDAESDTSVPSGDPDAFALYSDAGRSAPGAEEHLQGIAWQDGVPADAQQGEIADSAEPDPSAGDLDRPYVVGSIYNDNDSSPQQGQQGQDAGFLSDGELVQDDDDAPADLTAQGDDEDDAAAKAEVAMKGETIHQNPPGADSPEDLAGQQSDASGPGGGEDGGRGDPADSRGGEQD